MVISPKKLSVAVGLSVAVLTPGYASAAALEEIIVTANKRSESANDVGLSIAAVSGTKLTEQKLTSLEDISTAVPGLVYSASTANTPIFTLRGVGFNEQTLGAYPATSLYLDEAPMPFPVLASHAAFDLERMEVLKGPQGILFGQNSTGGAVNFIAAKPTDEFAAGGDISYGRFDKVEVNGFVSGPLTDTIGARLAIQAVNADEWQKSTGVPGEENGAEEYFAGRLILTFEPTDTARYMVNINGWKDESDPQAQQLIAINPQIPVDSATGLPPATLAPLLAEPFVPEDNRLANWTTVINNSPLDSDPTTDFDPFTDRDYQQFIFRGDWDLTDDVTLTALTTYQDFEQSQQTDGDGTTLVLFDLEDVTADIETWITEVRLAGMTENSRWVLGINHEASETEEDNLLRYIDNTNYTAANAFINGSSINIQQDITNSAVFGNVDYDLTDDLVLKLGARYTDSEIDAESCNYSSVDGQVAFLFNLLGGLFGTVPFDPIGGFPDCYTLNYDGVPGQAYVDTLSEDNTSWRVGLDYSLNEDTLLYANISKGYKTGSFPAIAAAFYTQLEPVTQESVLSYEAGFKSSLMDNRVQLNGAAFFYEYEDKQLRTKVLDPIFGFLDVLDNVPETEIMGIEADITALLGDNWTFTGAITYLDSEVTDYQGVSVTSRAARDGSGLLQLVDGLENFNGDPIPFTPELTYSAELEYRTPVSTGGEVFAAVNVHGQSESDAAFGGGRLAYSEEQIAIGARSITPYFNEMDGYAVWGARLGYLSADESWKVMLWGKNLADEYYVTNVIASSDNTSRLTGRPRTYGVTVGYTY